MPKFIDSTPPGIALSWPRKGPSRERLDEYAARLRSALAG